MKCLLKMFVLVIAVSCCRTVTKVPNNFNLGVLPTDKLNLKSGSVRTNFNYIYPKNSVLVNRDSFSQIKELKRQLSVFKKAESCSFVPFTYYPENEASDVTRVFPDLNALLSIRVYPHDHTPKSACITINRTLQACLKEPYIEKVKFAILELDTVSQVPSFHAEFTYSHWRSMDTAIFHSEKLISFKDYEITVSLRGATKPSQIDSLHKLSKLIISSISREDK